MKQDSAFTELRQQVAQLNKQLSLQQEIESELRSELQTYKHLYAMMQTIGDNVPDMICAKDMEQKYIFTNKNMRDTFLHNNCAEAVVGKTDFDYMKHEIAEIFEKSDIAAVLDGVASDTVNIDRRLFQMVKQRVSDNDGKNIGITAVIRETTEIEKEKSEKMRLEKKLRQSQKMEAIGTLAGGISHDFNNILTAILGYTEVAMAELEADSDVKDLLDEVYSAGIRARDLVQQILAFARQTEQELKPIRIDLIAKEALKLIRSTTPSTIGIEHSFLSKSLVMADPTQVHQIIVNLCTNAVHAMEQGEGGTLSVRIKDAVLGPRVMDRFPELDPGFYVKLEVEDTGTGIEERFLDAIFDPYFTTKESGEGTGLGLSVVHGIVKSYGGEISVSSHVGKGTLFKIYLPMIKSSAPEKHSDPMTVLMGNERILFIDDEENIARLGQRMLESLGYQVTTRTNSVEALELFRNFPEAFDLVVTDLTMPGITGDRLAMEMMKIRPDIPVILCTGFSKKFSDDNMVQNGIKAFQMKPLIKKDLAKTIRKVLDAFHR